MLACNKGFFYGACIVLQVMLIPFLILPYAVFAGPGVTWQSNVLGILAWVGIPFDAVCHILVAYTFAKLGTFDD